MSSDYVFAWLTAFAFTQLIEVPIYRRALSVSLPVTFGASAITHPIVWFVIFPKLDASYLTLTVLSELFAWLAEAAYFGLWLRHPRVLWVCLLANLTSVSLGLVSRALFGVP